MKTHITTPEFAKEMAAGISVLFTDTRKKIISVADVWNIQRQKRVRIQRRPAF